MEIVTTEILPPEASMAGKNTVYCGCTHLNKRSNYGVCLFTLKAFEEGKLQQDSDCFQTIKCGSCEAKKFRQQERDAGRALFFKPRVQVVTTERPAFEARRSVDESSASFKRGFARAAGDRIPVVTKPAPVKKPIRDDQLKIVGTLSEAVTVAVKEEVKAAKAVKPKQGLSLIERARLSLQGGSA